MDRFYTPPDLARFLVSSARDVKGDSVIADFSVGTGELLRHAKRRWPECKIIANDVDGDVVRKLRVLYPAWSIANCDFLNSRSLRRSPALRNALGRVHLCLLNPPFSCRGSRAWEVRFGNVTLRCSLALKFVIAALGYLNGDGELLAILPSGTLQSEKDCLTWRTLGLQYSISVLAENSMRTFQQCSVRTMIVRISRMTAEHPTDPVFAPFRPQVARNVQVALRRGVIGMASAAKRVVAKGSIPFVHTTELTKNSVCLLSRRTKVKTRIFVGPCILMSRVGRPDHRKVALYLGDAPIALSDCVIAIECKSAEHAFEMYSAILQRWPTVEARYGGTCARYLTIANLNTLLTELGFETIAPHGNVQHEEEQGSFS